MTLDLSAREGYRSVGKYGNFIFEMGKRNSPPLAGRPVGKTVMILKPFEVPLRIA